MPCGRRRGRNQPNGSSAVAVRRSAATRIGTLAYVPGCHYDLVYVLISRTFSTVDTASLQCMSIWSSSPNTAAVCSTARRLRNCGISSPRSAPTLRRGWCRWTGESNHVHLLVNYPPKVSVSSLVKSYVLGRQLPRITKGYWNNVLWSPSYFAASCGGAPLDLIQRYLEQQATPL